MKKAILVLMMVLLAVGTASAETKKKQPQVQPKVAAPQANPAQEMLAKKKAELNGQQWPITLTPMGAKGRAETDVVSFMDDKVASKNLEKLGFAPTNFTVRLQEDETLTWETMQTSEKEGVAFWRGDIKDGVMRGVLCKRKGEAASDFNFVSTAK